MYVVVFRVMMCRTEQNCYMLYVDDVLKYVNEEMLEKSIAVKRKTFGEKWYKKFFLF